MFTVDGGVRLVVQDGDTAIAWLVIRERQYLYGQESSVRYAEITELVVSAERRRQGLGRFLVSTALDWARLHGFERVAVESTARLDKPGPPFYEAMDFTARSTIWDVGL